jgi:hypothetical protein
VNFDFGAFFARHAIDVVFLIIFAVKLLVLSHANLRVKLVASFVLASVIYIGRAVTTQMAASGTSIVWLLTVAIGIRLVALKIIFTVVDWED